MDKQLLKALDNLSDALEKIAELMSNKDKSEKNSDVSKALQSGNFIEEIKEINIGVKSIKKDTEEILKQQKTILEMSKRKESDKKTGEFESDPKKESSIKKGVATILLIAVAVLAIGLAFKIVGKVDFLSVIGLGIAMVIVATAFEKIAKLKLTLKETINASFAMVAMSVGIAASSYFLSMVTPIGISQAITSIFIAGVFAIAGSSFTELIKSFEKSKIGIGTIVKTSLLLPLVLLGLSVGIWLSSTYLNKVQPIGFSQGLSAIIIAAVFAVSAFGLRKILKSFEGLSPSAAILASFLMPFVFVALSLAMMLSSKYLNLVQKISTESFIGSIMISALFFILSFSIKRIAEGIGKLNWKDVPKIPVFFVLISMAIAASAYILFNSQKYFQIEWMTMIKILALGAVLGVLGILFGIATKIIGDISWGAVFKLPLFFTLITLAIAISAFILFKSSKYFDGISFTTMFKILAFSIVLAIAVVVVGIVAKILDKLGGPVTYIKGGLAIAIIAATIAISSRILDKGLYGNYPGLKWALGVGLSLTAFGIAAGLLGLAVFGPQAFIFAAGLVAILAVAKTVVETSKIIEKGKYQVPGLFSWATSVAILFGTFTPIIIALGALGLAGGVLKFFGADDPFEKAKKMMRQIAETIVDVAAILSKGKFIGGPTEEWARGISIALGAFSPLYSMLMANGVMKIFGGGGIGPDDFSNAIRTVSEGIMYAAELFAGPDNKNVWIGGPPIEWAEGVGAAIGAFSPVLSILSQGSIVSLFGGKGVDAKAMKGAIKAISEGIVEAAYFFSKNSAPFLKNYPSKEWGEGVGASLNAFSPVFAALSGKSWFTTGDEVVKNMKNGILHIGDAIVKVAYMLGGYTLGAGGVLIPGKNKPDFGIYPTREWSDGIKLSIETFNQIFNSLEQSGTDIATFTMKSNMLSMMLVSMSSAAKIIHSAKNAFSTKIPKEWIVGISSAVIGYALLSKMLESILTTTEKKTVVTQGFFSSTTETMDVKRMTDMSIAIRTVSNLVLVAKILSINSKFFQFKIDPNFMKNVATNILAFAILTSQISRYTGGGGVMGMMRRMTGTDPMSQMADGLVKVAVAYDILAKSLKRFGDSLNSIDAAKVSLVRKLTGNIAILSSMDSEMFSRVMSVLESRASVFSKLLDSDATKTQRVSVGDRKGSDKDKDKKDDTYLLSQKNDKTIQKLDEIIKVLKQINVNTSGIDEWLEKQGIEDRNNKLI